MAEHPAPSPTSPIIWIKLLNTWFQKSMHNSHPTCSWTWLFKDCPGRWVGMCSVGIVGRLFKTIAFLKFETEAFNSNKAKSRKKTPINMTLTTAKDSRWKQHVHNVIVTVVRQMKVLLFAFLIFAFSEAFQFQVQRLETKKIGSNYECEACLAFFAEGNFSMRITLFSSLSNQFIARYSCRPRRSCCRMLWPLQLFAYGIFATFLQSV